MRRIGIIVWKEFRHLRNDPVSLRMMVVPIIFQVLVLGYAITTEVRNTPVTICDLCRTPQSRSLSATLQASKLFVFRGFSATEREIRARLDRGESRIGIIIPPDFAHCLQAGEGASVTLVMDGQDANSSGVAGGYVQAIISGWALSLFRMRLQAQGVRIEELMPLRIDTRVLFNPQLRSTWYMVPAMAVLLVTMITALLTGFSIVREKESGTLEQLLVTPVRPFELVMGKSLPYMLLGLVELIAVLVIAQLWFGIPFRGTYLTIIVMALIYMFSSIGVGILTSTIARTPHQALFLTWFILLFFILLSGFFLPLENMPGWVQNVTIINPVRYFMLVVRDVFLKGSGLADLAGEGVAMLIIGGSVYLISLAAFRRRSG